ncbi:SMAD/FHA domain-containing protein [Irpex rosettiformis]|uniref:SMAD/FHA domain-containing protein n=1 Tax=Irpex rosettiformis TaxID=378272 RepID=A0ACB8U1K3_9APHY|nr:SMAD/FHA domain-containing protein [Irpex rosettiformis]
MAPVNTVPQVYWECSFNTPVSGPTHADDDDAMDITLEPTQVVQVPLSTQTAYSHAIHGGAWGVLVPKDGKSPSIMLSTDVVYLGRGPHPLVHPEEHIQINHPNVSRMHCRLEWNGATDGTYEIRVIDHGSTNGTYIDDHKLQLAESNNAGERGKCVGKLTSGSIISLGTPMDAPPPEGAQENRYIYKHLASSMRLTRTLSLL